MYNRFIEKILPLFNHSLQRVIQIDKDTIDSIESEKIQWMAHPVMKFFTILGSLIASLSITGFFLSFWVQNQIISHFIMGIILLLISFFLQYTKPIFLYVFNICLLLTGYFLPFFAMLDNHMNVYWQCIILGLNLCFIAFSKNYIYTFFNALILPYIVLSILYTWDLNFPDDILFFAPIILSINLFFILVESAKIFKKQHFLYAIQAPIVMAFTLNTFVFYTIADFGIINYKDILILSVFPYLFILYILGHIFGKGSMANVNSKVIIQSSISILLLFVGVYPFVLSAMALLLYHYAKGNKIGSIVAIVMLIVSIIMAAIRSDIMQIYRGLFLIVLGLVFIIIFLIIFNKENLNKKINKKYSILDEEL